MRSLLKFCISRSANNEKKTTNKLQQQVYKNTNKQTTNCLTHKLNLDSRTIKRDSTLKSHQNHTGYELDLKKKSAIN